MLYHERKLEDINYAALAQKTLQLPRNNMYRALRLRLTGTMTTTAAAPTGLKSDAEHRIISRIEIVANGRDTIKSVPFQIVKLKNKADFGASQHNAAIGVAASTAYPFEANGYVDFCLPRAYRALDSALDARGLETLDIRITFGNEGSVYGVTNNAALSNVKLEIMTEEYLNIPDGLTPYLHKMNTIQREVTSTTDKLMEKMPTDTVYRRFLLVTEVDDVRVDTVLNSVALKSGTFVFKDVDAKMCQRDNKIKYNLESFDTGVYILDLITDGQITESINAKTLSSLEFIFNVTKQAGTNYIYIYPETVGV